MIHTPVLLKESIDYLITDKSGVYADGTIGFGGHAEKFLEILNDDATLIGCDVDKTAFDFCKNKFQNDKRVRLYNYNFDKIDFVLKVEGEKKLTALSLILVSLHFSLIIKRSASLSERMLRLIYVWTKQSQ